MQAKVLKAYRPQKELNMAHIKYTRILFNNEEHDAFVIRYDPESQILTFLSDISTKLKEGDIFFIGEKKDKDFKLEVIKPELTKSEFKKQQN